MLALDYSCEYFHLFLEHYKPATMRIMGLFCQYHKEVNSCTFKVLILLLFLLHGDHTTDPDPNKALQMNIIDLKRI